MSVAWLLNGMTVGAMGSGVVNHWPLPTLLLLAVIALSFAILGVVEQLEKLRKGR
jgi:hypothetical protein